MEAWQIGVVGSWLVFLVYWLISAPKVKAAAESQPWSHLLPHRLTTFVGGLLLFGPQPQRAWNMSLVAQGPVAGWAGAVLCILGIMGAVWSRRTLGRNWSSSVQFKRDHELVQEGPYRWARHPIYTSLLLMCVGSALTRLRVSTLLGLILMLVGFLIKLRQEEHLLMRHFPQAYPGYRARVKALIPFVI